MTTEPMPDLCIIGNYRGFDIFRSHYRPIRVLGKRQLSTTSRPYACFLAAMQGRINTNRIDPEEVADILPTLKLPLSWYPSENAIMAAIDQLHSNGFIADGAKLTRRYLDDGQENTFAEGITPDADVKEPMGRYKQHPTATDVSARQKKGMRRLGDIIKPLIAGGINGGISGGIPPKGVGFTWKPGPAPGSAIPAYDADTGKPNGHFVKDDDSKRLHPFFNVQKDIDDHIRDSLSYNQPPLIIKSWDFGKEIPSQHTPDQLLALYQALAAKQAQEAAKKRALSQAQAQARPAHPQEQKGGATPPPEPDQA